MYMIHDRCLKCAKVQVGGDHRLFARWFGQILLEMEISWDLQVLWLFFGWRTLQTNSTNGWQLSWRKNSWEEIRFPFYKTRDLRKGFFCNQLCGPLLPLGEPPWEPNVLMMNSPFSMNSLSFAGEMRSIFPEVKRKHFWRNIDSMFF